MKHYKWVTRYLAVAWLGLAFMPLRVIALLTCDLWPVRVGEKIAWSVLLGVEILGALGFVAGIGVLAARFRQGRMLFERGNCQYLLLAGLFMKSLVVAFDRSVGSVGGPPPLDYPLELARIGVAIVLVCIAVGMWLWVRRSGLQRTGGQAASGTPNPTR
jgi:hypothetical protein